MNISTVMNNQISKSPVQQLQMHISEVTYDWCILLLTLDIKRKLVFPSPETGGESGVKRQFKWKLILNLLKTTPEQPNPSKAKGQKHHLIHHKVALRRYLCTLQAVWTTVARACPQMFFLHVRRLFRWSDSDMTYLSHIIVFTDDLINHRCVFKSSISSRSCHKPYISVLFWVNEAILLYQLSETKPKQRKCFRLKSQGLEEKNDWFRMWQSVVFIDSAGHDRVMSTKHDWNIVLS